MKTLKHTFLCGFFLFSLFLGIVHNDEECNFFDGSISLLPENSNADNTDDSTDNFSKVCYKEVNSLSTLRLICPKTGKNFEGIELRPASCFEIVFFNGEPIHLPYVFPDGKFDEKETEQTIIRSVTIPLINRIDFLFECSCDNSLTFFKDSTKSETKNGHRGIMRIMVRKTKIFGCDFDFNTEDYKGEDEIINGPSPFLKTYEKNALNTLMNEDEIKCEITLDESEVNVGIRCPETYQLNPPNCFEEVYYKDELAPLDHLLKTKVVTHISENMKYAYASFSIVSNIKYTNIVCQCLHSSGKKLNMILDIDNPQITASSCISKFSIYTLTLLFYLFISLLN